MNRHDMFYTIHKGIRSCLSDTLEILQHTDFDHPEDTKLALQRLKDTIELVKAHGQKEDKFILEPLFNRLPEMSASFIEEHLTDHNLINQIIEVEEKFMLDKSLENWKAIQAAFEAFMSFNLKHMRKEETILNAAIWEQFSDLEIRNMESDLVASLSDEERERAFYWIFKGGSLKELHSFLDELKTEVPSEVYNSLLSQAEVAMGKVRFNSLTALQSEFQII